MSSSHANRGRNLETVVIASMGRVIRVMKTGAEAKFARGRNADGSPKLRAKKGVVDFVGTVIATGRAIHFDAKQTGRPQGFYMSLLEPHQLYHLGVFNDAKAIAGVLAECTDREIAAFFWIPYFSLNVADRQRRPCIPWNETQRIGSNLLTIDFGRVVEVAQELQQRGQS